MLRIHEIRLELKEEKEAIPSKIEKRLKLKSGSIKSWRIVKESVDARHKNNIKKTYTVDFEVDKPDDILTRNKDVKPVPSENSNIPKEIVLNNNAIELKTRPVIVGFGPCGIFAALWLARAGYKPVIIERGSMIPKRVDDVEKFWREGKLDEASNVQFGEGGAGAFSDGKLNSGIKNSYRTTFVLEELVKHGAPEDILYKQNPHVGTDVLRDVVVSIREEIQKLGGTFKFETKFTGFKAVNNCLKSVKINNSENLDSEILVIAPGHSARDTFKMIYESGLKMEQKSFSIGARIEHLQEMINISQYGSDEAAEILGAADYRLSYKCKDGRGVYTFCMCPGGYVVASSSEEECVVTNGMSYHSRNGRNANSALLVSVNPEDFDSPHPLEGIEFQRKWEKAAYIEGGKNYFAPAQKVGDFLLGKPSNKAGRVKPEYKPGVKWTDISSCLPDFAIKAMREALPHMGKKIKGFDMCDAVLTAVETRSSSPVRIIRDDEMQTEVKGIFPAGEGGGYAGGIMSAAVDGIRVAEKICELWLPMK